MKTETCSSDSWIHPNKLLGWQLALWRTKYQSGEPGYVSHYLSAVHHGNHISVARMEWFASACAMEKLKGAYAKD